MAYATCGHPISGDWLASGQAEVIRRTWSREGGRALSYEVLCPDCRILLRNELFKTPEDAEKWLRHETKKFSSMTKLRHIQRRKR